MAGRQFAPAWVRAAMLASMLWLALPVPTLGAAPEVPALRPDPVQDETGGLMARADLARLRQAVQAHSGPEQYKILLLRDGGSEPWPALPDAVDDAWDLPPETVLLAVGVKAGGKIRFYLSPGASRAGLNPDNTLAAIRARYNPLVRQGQLVDGLIALVQELHTLTGGAAPPAGGQAPDGQPAGAGEAAGDRGAGARLPEVDWGGLLRQRWLPGLLATAGGACVALALLGVGAGRGPGRRRRPGGRRPAAGSRSAAS